MKKYILLCLLLCQTFYLLAQHQLMVYDSFPSKIHELVIIDSRGYIKLEKSDTIQPISVSGFTQTYQFNHKDNFHYISILRNGKMFYYPLIQGKQYISFKNDSTNNFETDNSYHNTFNEFLTLSSEFISKYQNQESKTKKSKDLINNLSPFKDQLIQLIAQHPYKNELFYTYIKIFEYSIYKNNVSKNKLKKRIPSLFRELNNQSSQFNNWGYNRYLNMVLDDYFTLNMNMFNMPFRSYKKESLIQFVFKNDLFTNMDLNHYVSFYKLRELESVNDKNLIFYLADSLRNMLTNPFLKTELDYYLGKSETRVKPLAKAPNFFLKEVGKNQVYRLNELNDKLVVLDFWATWCGPCVRSFKTLKKLNHTYGDSVNFVSIGSDELEDKAIKFLEKNPEYTWKFLHDGKDGATGLVYEAYSIPKYVIIDLNGVIVLETHEISVVEQYLKEHFRY